MSEDIENVAQTLSNLSINNSPSKDTRSNDTRSFKPFRFLNLAAELRNNVYKYLPRSIHPKTFYFPDEYNRTPPLSWYEMTAIIRHMDASILQTCKQIHEEARVIFQELAAEFILSSPIRLIVQMEPGFPWIVTWPFHDIFPVILRRALRMQSGYPNGVFTTNLSDLEELERGWNHRVENQSGREVGKVSSPLWVWASQAAHQILHGSRQIEIVMRKSMTCPGPYPQEDDAMRHMLSLRTELRRYVPSMSVELLGFLGDRMTPMDLPQPPPNESAMDLWDKVSKTGFTPEEWAHDWFE